MSHVETPDSLGEGGLRFWRAITSEHNLDPSQLLQLEEVCRAKDRLDRLDRLLSGDVDTWATVMHNARTEDYELKIDDALGKANSTATVMKQMLAAMRLPDSESGKKPQARGGARGAYKPSGAKVSSLDRARAAKSS
ncbi:hypothetical protein [Nocardioides kribbensis]|uniref:Terminase n=1 Tax=Nocardioides kribbensis TaxID=305517 RepID=A0ABV1NYY0_9ACTN